MSLSSKKNPLDISVDHDVANRPNLLTYLLTYSIQQSPWEANRFSDSQEIPRILWNPKVHYRIRKCLLSQSWASTIQFIPPYPNSWISILILSSHLLLGLSGVLFPSGFPTKSLYMPLLSPYVLHVPPISFFSIWSPEQYWVRSTDD